MNRLFCMVLAGGLFANVLAAEETHAPPDLTLSVARALALQNHPRIAAANYRAQAAEQVVLEARSGFFPSANLYGTAAAGADHDNTRIMAGVLNNPSVMNRAAEGLGLSQLVTDFGRTANLTASSRYSARAESQNAATTREQVLQEVDEDYFGALQAHAVVQVATQTLATRQLLLDQVSLQASNKLKSELDVSFAQVALEQGRLLIERAQSDEAAAQAALSTALGFHEFRAFRLVDEPSPALPDTNNVSSLIETALQDRPELLSLRFEHDSALRFARSQRDARLPTIQAVGAIGNSPAHDDRLPENYAAGGVLLSMPLFSGGLYLARQHEAELRAQAAERLLQSEEDNVVRDVRIAWLNLNNARDRLRTTAQLLVHATDAFNLAQARYQVGSSSIVELSQAQLELTSAQIDNASARYDILIGQARLNYQVGATYTESQASLAP